MRTVRRDELLDLGEYERVRPRFRRRMMEDKRARRVLIGEHMSAVFESRETVLLQIQEMLRTERITTEAGIAHELDTYNELVPGPDQLSLTLFVEITDRAVRERTLVAWRGLERHVAIEVDGERFAATGEREGGEPERTTAVHYLKADLSPAAAGRVRAGEAAVSIVVDHPRCRERATLTAATLSRLAADLAEPS